MLTRIIAKTIVIDNDDRILLLVRSDNDRHRPGGYDLPGGQVDDGEDVASGAAREAREEIGLQLRPSEFRLVYGTVRVAAIDGTMAQENMVWLGFAARLPEGQSLQLGEEHSAFEWLSLREAAEKTDSENQRAFFRHVITNDVIVDLWNERH